MAETSFDPVAGVSLSHTPLPWVAQMALLADCGEEDLCIFPAQELRPGKSDEPCPVAIVDSNWFEFEANGALIVRAVNNHADLTAALQAMVDAYRDDCPDEDQPSMVRRALAVLAKVAA